MNDEERGNELIAPYGWALSTVMRKNDERSTTTRPMLGAYYECSEFEAVGQFADYCLENNKDFDMGQIIRLPLRSPNRD